MLFDEKANPILPILEALRSMELTATDAAEIIAILDKKQLISTIITKSDAGAEGITVGTIALKWAYSNHLIPNDITSGIVWFSKNEGERFIFTPEQAAELFSRPWPSATSKLANMLAMTTGLRSGEIMALKKRDLGDDCLYVEHSWNHVDKQKTTKNNENRTAYILFPEIREGLKKLAESNPYRAGMDGYIFWATIPGKPRENPAWLRDLRSVAKEIGFSEIEKISFHGWRHFFTTYMYNELDEKVLQKATGHKTIEMLDPVKYFV